ncbi:hypothetical protein [Roseateles asaccharophilus]|uniref:Tetratricopeptide repeat protein n=1 Tax=Roseateles asaccharophilus TaxID=582607 RepID=A0ABU2A6X4_9BURK|nr:hypothetical protein [Roseateles asaccharophilus]MDR7332247.1 hypothetical protein [Roseateles asaccharophilus]
MNPRLLPRLPVLAAGLLASVAAWATTPGPTTVIQCPGSEEIRSVPSIGSGNTFGAIFWTDGFMVAPMLPRFPAITRCTADGPIFWVSSAKVLGSLAPWRDGAASAPPSWRRAATVRELTGDEFLQAIDQGLGDTPDKLSHLRHRAWWAANLTHRPRSEGAAPVAASDFAPGSAARANLEALAAAQDESNPEQRLTKAEALRELGRFDEAGQLLDSGHFKDSRLQPWVTLIQERIRLRDARVARLKLER